MVYGYRPKIWFLLNSHDRSDTLLQKIQSTPFDESPGNNIGQSLEIHLRDTSDTLLCLIFLSLYLCVSLCR